MATRDIEFQAMILGGAGPPGEAAERRAGGKAAKGNGKLPETQKLRNPLRRKQPCRKFFTRSRLLMFSAVPSWNVGLSKRKEKSVAESACLFVIAKNTARG